MKKFWLIFVMMFLLSALMVNVALADSLTETELEVKIDGQKAELLFTPLTVGSKEMISAPDLALLFDVDFYYSPGNKTVTFVSSNKEVSFDLVEENNLDQAGDFNALIRNDGSIYVSFVRLSSYLGNSIYREQKGVDIVLKGEATPVGTVNNRTFSSLKALLPKEGQLFVPSSENFLNKKDDFVFVLDLDKDSKNENLMFYSIGDGKTGFIVGEENKDSYILLGKVEESFNLGEIGTIELDDKVKSGLWLLWDAGSSGKFVQVYVLKNNQYQLVFESPATKVEIGNYNESSSKELVLWNRDLGEGYNVEVYEWQGAKFGIIDCPAYYKEITKYYLEKILLYPNDKNLLYYYTDACVKSGEGGLALSQVNRGISSNLEYPFPQYFQRVKGDAYYQLGSYGEAIKSYQNAFDVMICEPEQLQGMYKMALAYNHLGKKDLAKEQLKKALNQGSSWFLFEEASKQYQEWVK